MAKVSLAAFNAVVLARSFNPSIIREAWLIKHGLLREDALLPGFVFTDQAANVPTERFALVVVPPQLQLAPATRELAPAVMADFLVPLVRALPHTPWIAAGLNFVWQLDPEPETIQAFTRRLFLASSLPLRTEFEVDDAQFGAYLSKNHGACRLKLDIKPFVDLASNVSRIQCLFNFHRAVDSEDAVDEICELLSSWTDCDGTAERLANKLVGDTT